MKCVCFCVRVVGAVSFRHAKRRNRCGSARRVGRRGAAEEWGQGVTVYCVGCIGLARGIAAVGALTEAAQVALVGA
jgi:hypothetical protein